MFHLPLKGCVALEESLYAQYRRSHPERFTVGWKDEPKKDLSDLYGRPRGHSCFGCLVRRMNPEDCDPCNLNPNRERMKRAGLL